MDPLLAKVKEGAARDLERLKGLKGGALEASDVSFYSAKLLKESYGVDHEAVRAYFPLDHVVATTLEIYQELLGLEFIEIEKWGRGVAKRLPIVASMAWRGSRRHAVAGSTRGTPRCACFA